jgi:hypothetical protein
MIEGAVIESEDLLAEEPRVVRTQATGDKIFFLKDGKRQWIKNPETLRALGFDFGQEKDISIKELYEYEDIGSIDMRVVEEGAAPQVTVTPPPERKPVLTYRRSA